MLAPVRGAGNRPVSDLAIETLGLTKRFGRRTAVDGIDLAVPTGAVFGFLGPNGSGKTTTIRMLLGLASATSGKAKVLGAEMPSMAHAVLPEVGAVVEGPAFYPWLSGRDNLVRFDSLATSGAARRRRRERVDTALEKVGLAAAATRRYRRYSLGMKQRLALAAALVRPTRLLILDEPTNGLDPQGMREVRALIADIAGEGRTVFLSTHLLSEVELVCTDAAVMSSGRMVAQGPLAELRSRGGRAAVRIGAADPPRARAVLSSLPGGGAVLDSQQDCLKFELGDVTVEAAVAALVRAGIGVRSVVPEATSLEDAFVALTGEGFEVS